MKSTQSTSVKKGLELLAFGISAFFSPYVTATAFIVVITYLYAVDVRQFLPWVGVVAFFGLVLPGVYILYQIEKNHLKDIHLSDHSQRKVPFLVTGISTTVGAIILAMIGAAKPVVVMGVAYAVNALAIGLLTIFWKVSIHTALYSSIVTVLVILLGAPYAWLYLVLIPLGWSRIYRNRHTFEQVIGGSLLAFVLTSLVFWVFGYI